MKWKGLNFWYIRDGKYVILWRCNEYVRGGRQFMHISDWISQRRFYYVINKFGFLQHQRVNPRDFKSSNVFNWEIDVKRETRSRFWSKTAANTRLESEDDIEMNSLIFEMVQMNKRQLIGSEENPLMLTTTKTMEKRRTNNNKWDISSPVAAAHCHLRKYFHQPFFNPFHLYYYFLFDAVHAPFNFGFINCTNTHAESHSPPFVFAFCV